MKLYYISASILPSVQANSVHVMKMCQAWADQGHQVSLFAAKANNYTDEKIYDYYGVKPNFDLRFIKRLNIKGLWGLAYIRGLHRQIKIHGLPDLFYGRHAPSLLALALKNPNVKISYEAHALPFGFLRRSIEKKLLQQPSFKKLVVISEILKQDYLDLFPFLKDENILVAHDGADLCVQSSEPMMLKGQADTKVGYIGKLTVGKGLGVILNIAQQLSNVDFHVFGGSQNEVTEWQKKAKEIENIYFYGHVAHGELNNIYPSLDIMLAPLQNKMPLVNGKWDIGRWTSPLKIFEYMAQKKAIIASDNVVLREILENNKTAILVDPELPNQWVDAVRELAASQAKREQLGQEALSLLEGNYTWRMRAERILFSIKQSSKR